MVDAESRAPGSYPELFWENLGPADIPAVGRDRGKILRLLSPRGTALRSPRDAAAQRLLFPLQASSPRAFPW